MKPKCVHELVSSVPVVCCTCGIPCSLGLRAYAAHLAGQLLAELYRAQGHEIDLGEINAAICLDKWHEATDPRSSTSV